jgi:hypothetical protein
MPQYFVELARPLQQCGALILADDVETRSGSVHGWDDRIDAKPEVFVGGSP